MEPVRYSRKVNFYETDQMGIVHHSNYIRYFEEARLEMMDRVGLNYREMEQMGLMIPVLSVQCDYLQPLHYGETVEVFSALTKFDGIKMECSYEIRRVEDGKCTTVGGSKHCFLDHAMKPVRMKRVYPEIYHTLKNLLEV